MKKILLVGLGEKLRKARIEARLSILQVARKAGVSVASISKIEQSKMVPTINMLLRIVRVYNQPPSFFIDEKTSEFEYYFTKPNERRNVSYYSNGKTQKGVDETISAPFASGIVDAGIITLYPKVPSFGYKLTHDGEEVAYCLKGKIKVALDRKRIMLEPGDSIHFDAKIPHNYDNVGSQEAKVIYFTSFKKKSIK